MAPGRRKGANKAAAARRKWKVGDLVLAKIKGFPPWPATVSEPQKWGYPADLKKVLVHFFGTQQIALCSPADVEEFTEEKKGSLSGKRYGKGSDFVRALNEIIDCFEKLKKQDQDTSDNLTEETIVTNENNSAESMNKSMNDETPVLTVKQLPGEATNDLNSLTEAALAAAAEEDALHDQDMQSEETHSNSGFTETRAYSTRSKTDVAQSQNTGTQRRISSRRLRSSSRIGARGLQKFMLPSINNTSSWQLGCNALQDRCLRISKRIMKSSDDEGNAVDSPVCILNDNMEENDSDIMTVDSGTLSPNDGSSSVDSGCKLVVEEPFNENNEGEMELNVRLDFQTNATIIKKKRKPIRKRNRNDIVTVAKLDEVISETEVPNAEQVSPNTNGRVAERNSKENGDEHLPLVKRARVRMGRASPAGDEEGTLLHEEEKTFKVSETFAQQFSKPTGCKGASPVDGESIPFEGELSDSNLLHSSPSRKPQCWETRMNFMDGEAALPPSKRLHRALEAMSANVAEYSQRASSSPTSSSAERSQPSIAKKAVVELGSRQVEDHCSSDPQSSASEFRVCLNMVASENDGKTFVVSSDCGKSSSGINMLNPESCKDPFEHEEAADSKHLKLSPLTERHAETDAGPQHVIPSINIDEQSSHLECNRPCLIRPPDGWNVELPQVNDAAKSSEPETSQMNSDSILVEEVIGCSPNIDRAIPLDSANGGGVEPPEVKDAAKSSDPEISQMNSDSILVEEVICGSPNIESAIPLDSAKGGGDETHKVKNQCLSKSNQDSKRSKFVEEAKPASTDSNIVASASQVNVLTGGLQGYTLHSYSNSNSDDRLKDQVVSVTRSSTYLTDGPESVTRAPPASSICHISAVHNDSYVEKNGSCSNVQLHLEKAKLIGKSSNNLELLSSFEAIIRSLTRTKETIVRATRIAIDCAKYGFSTKVMEILACNLESESSPRKKVDLFFLVDSIAQCSVGMKGDAGVYPSAIQVLLPRLLLAAAPPPTSFYENHRQCLKVLRVWLERKILPEPIIRHHIQELEALYASHVNGGSRRSCRYERPFDDPIRQMEGMLVDEYGSNSSIQLPGFCMPPMLREDAIGSDSDGESFEAVTPEHTVENLEGERTPVASVEKRSHILEDVDGELEMEDVAPSCEIEEPSTSNIAPTDCAQVPHHRPDNYYGAPFAPQPPNDSFPISVPPPPPPPSEPPPPPPSAYPPKVLDSVQSVPDSRRHLSSQESRARRSPQPSVKPRALDGMHHNNGNKDSEAQFPRQMPYCSNGFQPVDGSCSNGFHLRPPHPAPSNQFSYVQERQTQSQRDIPPPTHPNRFHMENRNFYRDRDRNKFPQRDNIGEYWRPPLPSVSGPYYHDGPRMAHAPMTYNGPPREPGLPNNRWNNFHHRSMNHRQFNPYRPPSEGPIPMINRGTNFWNSR